MKYVKYVSITIFDLNKYYHNEHIYYVINIRDLMNKFLKNISRNYKCYIYFRLLEVISKGGSA